MYQVSLLSVDIIVRVSVVRRTGTSIVTCANADVRVGVYVRVAFLPRDICFVSLSHACFWQLTCISSAVQRVLSAMVRRTPHCNFEDCGVLGQNQAETRSDTDTRRDEQTDRNGKQRHTNFPVHNPCLYLYIHV